MVHEKGGGKWSGNTKACARKPIWCQHRWISTDIIWSIKTAVQYLVPGTVSPTWYSVPTPSVPKKLQQIGENVENHEVYTFLIISSYKQLPFNKND
jgi:hypothetical protein